MLHTSGKNRRKISYTVDPAYPDVCVVEQVTAGDSILRQGGSEYLIGPGDAYLLHMGRSHAYKTGPAGWVHKRFAELSGPLLPSVLRLTGLIDRDIIKPDNPVIIAALLKRLYRLLDKTEPDWYEKLSLAGYELLMQLKKNLAPRYPSPLSCAISYIERNLGSAITLEKICAHADISPTHLCRLFKQHLNMAPMKFYAQQRMAWAQRILRQPHLSIKEAAAMLGYDDQLYFSARFKKHFGVSPREYRKVEA